MNLADAPSDKSLMGVVRALVALTITLAVLGAGFWIGKRWIPPLETEVVDGLVVEKLCRAWTDGCDVYARNGRKDVFRSASSCKTERVYKCVSYGW
ncbi:MAG: hypothetical protein AB1490_09125 [Pseudomonadota bacterium]